MGFSAVMLALLVSTGLAGVHYGAPPPDVPLPAASGGMLGLQKGKPAVIHFWATWCHVCLTELPRFAKLAKRYGSSIDLITVSNEREDVAASYLRLWDMRLPLVADTTGAVFKAYGVGPLPATVVVDAAGNVSYVQVGETSQADLDRALTAALAGISGSSPLP
ncbi:MAG TPA: TlpA disulfide reductase family protein [Candidatus Baltobacteraceae bacterium]